LNRLRDVGLVADVARKGQPFSGQVAEGEIEVEEVIAAADALQVGNVPGRIKAAAGPHPYEQIDDALLGDRRSVLAEPVRQERVRPLLVLIPPAGVSHPSSLVSFVRRSPG